MSLYNEMIVQWRDFNGNWWMQKVGDKDWFIEVVQNKMLPLMKKMTTTYAPTYTYEDYETGSFHETIGRIGQYVDWENRKENVKERNQKVYEMAKAFNAEYVRLALVGMGFGVGEERVLGANLQYYMDALAKTNEVGMVKVARAVGLGMNGWN